MTHEPAPKEQQLKEEEPDGDLFTGEQGRELLEFAAIAKFRGGDRVWKPVFIRYIGYKTDGENRNGSGGAENPRCARIGRLAAPIRAQRASRPTKIPHSPTYPFEPACLGRLIRNRQAGRVRDLEPDVERP